MATAVERRPLVACSAGAQLERRTVHAHAGARLGRGRFGTSRRTVANVHVARCATRCSHAGQSLVDGPGAGFNVDPLPSCCGAADPSGASDSNLTDCLRMICASACWSMILGGRQGQHGPMDRVGWCWGMRLSMDLFIGGQEACVACFVVPRARCVLPILRLRDARKRMLSNA